MNDTPTPAPSPTPDIAPAPAPNARPEWVPEAHWDGEKSALKLDDFGKHYSELATFHKAETEKRAGVPAKAEDYKADLPEEFTKSLPKDVEIKFDDKDPVRGPVLQEARALAHELGIPQAQFGKLLSLQAKLEVAQQAAERAADTARVAEETKKLGANAEARLAAAGNWARGFGFTAGELAEVQFIASTADGVSAIEKIMAKASGSVPGQGNPPPPQPPVVPIEQRWYGATTPQQKVS